MRKLKFLSIGLITLLLSVLLTNCNNKPSAETLQLETVNKQLAKNLEMYENVWDKIVNNGQIDQINESNFDKNITLVASPENIVGIENFKNYYNNFLTGFSDISFTIVDVFGQGDKIVKHWNFKGTHTGDFFGIPATNKEVNLDGVTIVQMKIGIYATTWSYPKIVEFNIYSHY